MDKGEEGCPGPTRGGRGVNAGMVCVCVIPCYTRPISERFRDKGLIIKRYINSYVYLFACFLIYLMFFLYSAQQLDLFAWCVRLSRL